MKKNKELKEAGTKLKTMSRAEYRERMEWFREKARLDYNTGISCAERRGREEGERKGKLETAKKMLAEGIELERVLKITGLEKEEILSNK